ncbi:glycogen synthase GlgA [Anaeromicrobium sediminis]|uniref:Glycogen synthase n=1 Tax=Anaeromicrobium sediminis TaxID=1478221 RepID=A0A267MJ15_9FIRM|nr:glycogen synthase GlgA [Anaeromicrobium sediminis]PAB58790.1 starch synthase [Anaeromicrobium sediminis]
MLKILYVASEAVPFIKTGGLADVAFSLPKALRKLDVDIRVIVPKYKEIKEQFTEKMKHLISFQVPVAWRRQHCGIDYLEYEGVPFYFVDNDYYFKRDGLYGHYDDGERFSYFCKAVLESMENIDFVPDVIHCNDWHTGMIPVLLNEHYKKYGKYDHIKTIFTIHNLKYQGVFPEEILEDVLGLGMEYYDENALEFYGGVSFMKGGIKYSNLVTTVSETYSNEIQYPFFGERLDGLLRHRKNDLHGLVNGIDYDIYDPSKDENIFEKFSFNSIEKKQENKIRLQENLNLPKRKDVPMISMVCRLANMKGLDLVLHILEDLLCEDVQLVILGTGDEHYESKLKEIEHKYPEKLSANILFDEGLAHKIYAASDTFLMPSLFEPCGLGQLIALRYGSVPIVRETGGLNDTIKSFSEYTGEGNGFSFTNYNAHDMLYTIKTALKLYRNNETWEKIVKNAMSEDYSWNNSANTYKKLYHKIY